MSGLTSYNNDYYRKESPYEDGYIPPSITSEQEYYPYNLPSLESVDIYAPVWQDEERRRQQNVAAQLHSTEIELKGSSSDYYYDS